MGEVYVTLRIRNVANDEKPKVDIGGCLVRCDRNDPSEGMPESG
jgi:hypothetical protein